MSLRNCLCADSIIFVVYIIFLIEFVLLVQFGLGIWIAVELRWGSQWYAAVMVPYLRSIFTLDPNISAVSAMPIAVQLHVIGAFLFILLIPFTRLVHFLVAPFHYITRPYQIVSLRDIILKIQNQAVLKIQPLFFGFLS